MDFGSLWIGSSLSKVEQTALASYIYHGHSLTLFVYDMNLEVPKGVVKKDASTLISESEIFKVDNSYAAFSDIFRYKMIKETGLTWTDTDCICLRPDWNFGDHILGFEDEKIVANSILKIPSDSPMIDSLINISSKYDKIQITWSELGPVLVTQLVKRFNIIDKVQPVEVLFPIHYHNWYQIWSPEHKDLVLNKVKNSHSLQLWNQFLNRNGINKNDLPQGSAIEHFYNKFISQYS